MGLPRFHNPEDAIRHLHDKGFTQRFAVQGKLLFCPSLEKSYLPAQLELYEHHRFSNGQESVIIYALGTQDQHCGLLIDRYTDQLNMEVITFMDKVPMIRE